MSAVDLAAFIASVASVVAVVLLAFGVVALRRTLTTLRDGIDELRADTLPLVRELHNSVTQMSAELERLEGAIESVRSVSGTVDAASRLAYNAVANPVIKAMALGAGTAKAARSLRQR